MSLLSVESLRIRYAGAETPAVDGLDFGIARGEALGIVGESGSGKTQTALAIMGLTPANARVDGRINFDGHELVGAKTSLLNQLRACRIAIVFQDPRLALNPYIRVGKQMKRVLLEHGICGTDEARTRTLDMLARVGLPDPSRQYRSFPHQLSGGMRQRVMIGAALLGEPDLLIADEPTTALDVTVQAQILRLIGELRAETHSALLLITHDLGIVAGNCERMLVMDGGRLVEEGQTSDVFDAPQSEQTRALLAAAPSIASPVISSPAPGSDASVLIVDELAVSYRGSGNARGEHLRAVRGVSFGVRDGETLAIVGESGSGKTSLVRAALGLISADSGRVSYLGKVLPKGLSDRRNDTRRNLQMVFQDPLASLDPAMMIGEIVAEPLAIHERDMSRATRRRTATEMLLRVGLDASLFDRYPHELSGGQAQRVAIARALILTPKVLICDEAVAALDGTVQRGILDLLLKEQSRSGLTVIFITHDLAVVRQISHRILVMYMGKLCEIAANDDLFSRPRHPYSKALINAVPVPDPGARAIDIPLSGETASILNPPPGCAFHPRCSHAVAKCSEEIPEPAPCKGTIVACHRAAELDLSY